MTGCKSLPAMYASSRLRLRNKLISHAAYGEQVARLRRFAFDVSAQTDDEVVDGTGVSVFAQVPHVLKNRLARDCLALVLDEIAQQVGFHQGELKAFGTGTQLQVLEVDGLVAEGEAVAVRRLGLGLIGLGEPALAAQQANNAREE